MPAARTGAQRYLDERLQDPGYRDEFERAQRHIEQVNAVIRALDERRAELKMSKAELARRAGIKPEAVRRLFSADNPNPTLHTLVALAGALGLELHPKRRNRRRAVTPRRSGARRTPSATA